VGRGGTKAFCFRCKETEGNWRTLDLDCKFDDSLPDTLARKSLLEAQTRAAELTARRNRGIKIFCYKFLSNSSAEQALQGIDLRSSREEITIDDVDGDLSSTQMAFRSS
jgi:hypothetical protein